MPKRRQFNRLKGPEDPSMAAKPAIQPRQRRGGTYSKVFHQRKRRLRRLWERNGAYYTQLTVCDNVTGKRRCVASVWMQAGGDPVVAEAEAAEAVSWMKRHRDEQASSPE
jgi:hypothetical protein